MMEMEGHMNTPVAQQWTNLIRFRSPDKLAAVITQTFLLIAAFMAILGFIYVICTVIIITIHHFLYDRDPNKIPDFVKNSVQFSSEDDDSDGGGEGEYKKNTEQVESSTNTKYKKLPKTPSRVDHGKGPRLSKKGLILDIFMSGGGGVDKRTSKQKTGNKINKK